MFVATHNEIDGPHVQVRFDLPIATEIDAGLMIITNTDRLDTISTPGYVIVDDYRIDFLSTLLWFAGDNWSLTVPGARLITPQSGIVIDLA